MLGKSIKYAKLILAFPQSVVQNHPCMNHARNSYNCLKSGSPVLENRLEGWRLPDEGSQRAWRQAQEGHDVGHALDRMQVHHRAHAQTLSTGNSETPVHLSHMSLDGRSRPMQTGTNSIPTQGTVMEAWRSQATVLPTNALWHLQQTYFG